MKKTLLYSLAALVLAGAVSCNRQEMDVQGEVSDGKYLLEELTASLDEGTKSSLTNTGIVNWSSNDYLAVIQSDGAIKTYKLKAGAGSPIGKFVPVSDAASFSDASELRAVYPRCAVTAVSGENISLRINQDLSGENYKTDYGITSWTADSQFAFAQNDVKVAKATAANTGDNANGVNFKFQQLVTMCDFVLDFTGTTEDYSSEKMESIKISGAAGINGTSTWDGSSLSAGDADVIDWTFASPKAMSQPQTVRLAMYPQVTTASTLSIVVKTTDHTFTFTAKPNQNLESGSWLKFPIQVDKNFTTGGTTLAYSVVENTSVPFYYYGESNCFLLANDATNGSFTVNAYQTNSKYQRINADGSAAPAVNSAVILWQDTDGLISDVTYTSGTKTVSYNRASGKYGNAVIAIKDGSDNILWSYHIWCPQDNPGEIVYTNTNSGPYTVMTMPLGATKDIHGAEKNADPEGFGLLYQWGRKDPLGRSKAIAANTMDDYYGSSLPTANRNLNTYLTANYTGNVADPTKAEYKPVSRFMADYAIAHPNEFITVDDGTYGNDWAGEANDYFWGNYRDAGSFPSKAETYKSIFDPSPAGYRVVPEDLWVNFTTTGANVGSSDFTKWNMAHNGAYTAGAFEGNVTTDATYKLSAARGYSFYYDGMGVTNTDFYPASGARNRTSGALSDVGSYGYYWSSAPSGASARFLGFYATGVYPLNATDRPNGFPLRCINE